MTETTIASARPADLIAITGVYDAAFPDEDLVPLVRALSALPEVTSLVAVQAGDVVGHVMFSPCGLAGQAGAALALLGPLAVRPGQARQGIGSALVRDGFTRLRGTGVARVLVLGDPGYYGRFGFVSDAKVEPPFPLPAAYAGAWQGLDLGEAPSALGGVLTVPAPWDDRALWSE